MTKRMAALWLALALGLWRAQLALLAPLDASSQAAELDPEESAGKFDGDMVLTEAQLDYLRSGMAQRNGLIAETKRWPNNIVWYRIVGDFDSEQRAAIAEGIADLEANTCVRFRVADAARDDFVAIGSAPGGCYTAVGYTGRQQEMNLEPYPVGEGCFRAGTILHEFMHALGFYHEQSSALRDDFINVVYDNIIPGKEFNFQKYPASVVTDFGVGYDFDSCLHYRAAAFSKNGQDTIVPYDPQAQIGQRWGLSPKDIDKINIMYKCPIKI